MAIQQVNVIDFGAKGSGSDDTNAIKKALESGAGSVVLPKGDYRLTSTLVIPEHVILVGHGRGARLIKAFDGDMVDMRNGAQMMQLELDGRGNEFGGRGVIIESGHDQKISNCAIINTKGYCVEYVRASIGSASLIDGSLVYTQDKTKLPAIKYPDEEDNGDRKILSVDANGGLLADFAGCATILVTDCNMIGVRFGQRSRKVALVSNRIAGGTEGIELEVYGSNHLIVGNLVATAIRLKPGVSNSVIKANISSGIINESTAYTNLTDNEEKRIGLIGGYGAVSLRAAHMTLGAGGKSPDAGSISFGDRTGWKLNIGTRDNGGFVPMFSFYDKGGLYFTPIPVSDARNGTVFVDIADGALKFKDADGRVNRLYEK